MKWLVPLSELGGVTKQPGGVGHRYAATLGELTALGVEATVIIYPDMPIEDAQTLPSGVRLIIDHRWARMPSIVRPIFRAIMFRSLARKLQPDIVFAPEWLGTAALTPRKFPLVTNLVTGIQLMSEIEDSAGRPTGWRRRLQRAVQGFLEKLQIRRSDRSIGCSTAISEWYRAHTGLPADSGVVRNCIDVDRTRIDAVEATLPEGWPYAQRVLLHAGRVEVRKGAHTSIEAFNLLAPQHVDLWLVLAGGVGYALPEWGELGIVSLIEPQFRNRVVFLGNVRSDKLHRAMAEADVCVVPSLWEAFGNIALEVKASRTPLVVTSGSGFDDFCQDGSDSRVVAPAAPMALAEVVDDLLTDAPQRAALVEAAAEQVDDYSARAVAVDLKQEVERPAQRTVEPA